MEESLPKWPDPDKLLFRKVNSDWSVDELLDQDGWFSLVDVVALLDPNETGKYRMILSQREKLIKIGRDPSSVMGLQPFGRRLWANMTVFNRWFRQNEAILLKRIPKNWKMKHGQDLNRLAHDTQDADSVCENAGDEDMGLGVSLSGRWFHEKEV